MKQLKQMVHFLQQPRSFTQCRRYQQEGECPMSTLACRRAIYAQLAGACAFWLLVSPANAGVHDHTNAPSEGRLGRRQFIKMASLTAATAALHPAFIQHVRAAEGKRSAPSDTGLFANSNLSHAVAVHETGPLSYVGKELWLKFKTSPKVLGALLPPQIKPKADGGDVLMAMVADYNVSGANMPKRQQLTSMLMVPGVEMKGKPGYYVPVFYLDNPNLFTDKVLGWRNKPAEITFSESAKGEIAGIVERHGSKIIEVTFSPSKDPKARAENFPYEDFGPLWSVKQTPSINQGGAPELRQITSALLKNMHINVFQGGSGTLKFGSTKPDPATGQISDPLALIPVNEILDASLYDYRMEAHAGEVVYDEAK